MLRADTPSLAICFQFVLLVVLSMRSKSGHLALFSGQSGQLRKAAVWNLNI